MTVRKPSREGAPAGDLRSRWAALLALGNVVQGSRYLDEAFDAALKPYGNLSASDRGFARLLVTTALRRLGQIDAIINPFLTNPGQALPSRVRNALRLGAAQVLFLDTPPHAAVDTTVRLVAGDQTPDVRRLKGLANAVMRRIATQGPAIAAAEDGPRLNTPPWLWESWEKRFGVETTAAIATAHMEEPALDLTCKRPEDRDRLLAELAARQLDVMPSPTGGLRLRGAGGIENLPGFEQGDWWVQDAAAALPVQLMRVRSGQRVVDLCAAPGGKTAQLAAAGARVTALDLSSRRLRRVVENLKRLELEAELVAADACRYVPDEPFDHVLLDAPCTATGTLRRHPDGLIFKKPEDLTRLVEIQERLLAAAAEMVRPGGALLYCVCSLEAEEGPRQTERFLAAHPEFALDPVALDELPEPLAEARLPDGAIQTLPLMAGGVDGFYIARLRRRT